MVCEENETDVDIGIPAVMLPQDAGETLQNYILNKSAGMFSLSLQMCIFFCNQLCFSWPRGDSK